MFVLLIGGGVFYLLLGDRLEALLLLAFATLSVAITIVKESRSERVLDALRDLASPRALVVRDGRRMPWLRPRWPVAHVGRPNSRDPEEEVPVA
jgi:Ca2+-transporting ATPase